MAAMALVWVMELSFHVVGSVLESQRATLLRLNLRLLSKHEALGGKWVGSG